MCECFSQRAKLIVAANRWSGKCWLCSVLQMHFCTQSLLSSPRAAQTCIAAVNPCRFGGVTAMESCSRSNCSFQGSPRLEGTRCAGQGEGSSGLAAEPVCSVQGTAALGTANTFPACWHTCCITMYILQEGRHCCFGICPRPVLTLFFV